MHDGMYRILGEWTSIFAFIGVSIVAILVVVLIANIVDSIKNVVKLRIKKYKDRHRFEKPPTAKCYCIACDYWLAVDSKKTYGRCTGYQSNGYMMDAGEFCSRGVPRTDASYEHEKWRIER